MITAIKLFYQEAIPMVALYGTANDHGDGWQCNLPAQDVLAGDPSSLPAEEQLLVADAEKLVGWTAAFQARLAKETPPMRMPELVNAISNSTGVPEDDVRRVVVSVLRQLRTLVESGGQLNSDSLRLRPHPQAAARGAKRPALAKQRLALLIPKG
jgi:hypothetical protein